MSTIPPPGKYVGTDFYWRPLIETEDGKRWVGIQGWDKVTRWTPVIKR